MLLLPLLLLLILPDCELPGSGQPTPTPETVPPPGYAIVHFPQAQLTAELARTPEERAQGLSSREPLGEREGMLFVFEAPGRYSFWMKEMRFALDMLWIEDGRVVHVERHVPPPVTGLTDLSRLPVYTPSQPATYVLEVNAGFADRHAIGPATPVTLVGVER